MLPRRSTVLTINAAVALAVGTFALALPQPLLEGKGVELPNDAAAVWVREVGVIILALGVIVFPIAAASYARPDLPATLAVGPNIYSLNQPDLTVRFDEVVFAEVSDAAGCSAD